MGEMSALAQVLADEPLTANRAEGLSRGKVEVPLEFRLKVQVENGELTAEEAEEIREMSREHWRTRIREEVALQRAKRKAELEAKYGMELNDADYARLSQAELAYEPCRACRSVYCDKWDGKQYKRPKIRVVNGQLEIGDEYCPQWSFYVNELCARAGVPPKHIGKTLADYERTADNASAIESVKWYVEEYPREEGLYYYGGVGTGKTLLASILARELILRGRRVIFGDVPTLLKKIKERFDAENMKHYDDNITADMILNRYIEVEVLILDDIGAGKQTDWTVAQLYDIINTRSNLGKRTIVTSNYELSDDASNRKSLMNRLRVGGAEMEAERIVSRLMEMCEDVFFGTRDRRKARRFA